MADPSYFNRELSWIEFNQRVLNEATNRELPLLERMKFLAITASNLDEFYMVRVGGLHILAAKGVSTLDPSGMTPIEQLDAIRKRVRQMVDDQYTCFHEIEGRLADASFRRLVPDQLNDRQRHAAERVFESEVFSVLTPMAINPDEPFPLLVNQMSHLAVQLAGPPENPDAYRFAVIPLGKVLNRRVTLSTDRGYVYMLLEDLATTYLSRFFPNEQILGSAAFRITRNADFSLRDDLAFDLVSDMQSILTARKHGDCVRLEVAHTGTQSPF